VKRDLKCRAQKSEAKRASRDMFLKNSILWGGGKPCHHIWCSAIRHTRAKPYSRLLAGQYEEVSECVILDVCDSDYLCIKHWWV